MSTPTSTCVWDTEFETTTESGEYILPLTAKFTPSHSNSLSVTASAPIYQSTTPSSSTSSAAAKTLLFTPSTFASTSTSTAAPVSQKPLLSYASEMDSSLAPKPFGGKSTDIVNAERWLRYFQQYVAFRHLKEPDVVALFKMLLIDEAQDWLLALPDVGTLALPELYEQFHNRYFPNELQRYQTAATMWSRVQQPTESVESFITSMKTAANKIDMHDDQQLIYCIIRGLKPNIRLHVLQNSHATMSELLRSARVAEIASAGHDANDQAVAELSKTVSVLVNKLTTGERSSSVSVVTQPTSTGDVDIIQQPRPPTGRPQSATSRRGGWSARRPPVLRSGQPRLPSQQPQPHHHQQQQSQMQYQQPYYAPPSAYQQPDQHQPGFQQSYRPQRQGGNRPTWTTSSDPLCGNCAAFHTMGVCPAYGKVCYNCNKSNHFARVCRSRSFSAPQQNYSQ